MSAAGAVGAVLWVGGCCGSLGWLGAALDRRDDRRAARPARPVLESAETLTPIADLLTEEGDRRVRD